MSLAINNVSLVLGDGDQELTVLDKVSLAINAGEFSALLGPSGSGKSSLLAVSGGLRQPSSGVINIDKTDISQLKQAELTKLRRQKIGFVFQQSNLLPSLTALDQLLLTVHISGRSPNRQDKERAISLLDSMGLFKRMDRRPGQLSGGEKQRVGIARALMSKPSLLLLDEPTSALDHKRGRDIVELIAAQSHQHNVATLMVTHDQTMIDCADRVFTIEDGRVSAG